ncbi:MAG: RNA-binding protein [Candidatus Kapabacteria bacterium]|nr:RNA-binding protein [Candidatus Kapabacteria bacterium]
MKLYIGNISYQTKDSDLESLFAAHGDVVSARVMMDKQTGRSRGFGFVEMASDEAGSNAITACNQMNFMGRTITVNEARPQEQRAPRSGGYSRGGGRGDNYGNRRDDY